MKKLISLLLCAAMMSSISVCAFADGDTTDNSGDGIEVVYPTDAQDQATTDSQPSADTQATTETQTAADAQPAADTQTVSNAPAPTVDPVLLSTEVTLQINIDQSVRIKNSTARFELYDEAGTLLAVEDAPIEGDEAIVYVTFNVPQYTIGKNYTLKLVSGLTSVRFYDDTYVPGDSFNFSTYRYEDSDGVGHNSEGIIITATPLFEKGASVKYDGVPLSLNPKPLVLDGVTMVPIRALAEYIGFTVTYNETYNVEIVSLGSNKIYFNVDTVYTTAFGNDLNATHPTANIEGTIYVSLRTFSEIIGSTLDVYDTGTEYDINMSASPFVNNYFNSMSVNKWGISSSTNYMVWVSLSEYKVRVYKGKKYQWQQVYEAPCAIGASGTPTITGSYAYQYTDRWNYDGYYVGPCLVFYGGYALHSVLLNYDGTEYDGRVGVKISHGCVRLKKKDIDWIYNTIPLQTRIFLTN